MYVPSSTGGSWTPRETREDHRGQFPRTNFGQAAQIQSFNNAARTPKSTLVWGTTILHRLPIQACFYFELLFLSSRPQQTIEKILKIPIAGRKCLCVSRKAVLWSEHFDIRISVPMLYLKFCNRPSVRPSRRVRAMVPPCSFHVCSTFLNTVTVFDLAINSYVNDAKRRAAI